MAEFAKLKSIFRSQKVKLNFKIRLFKAACISIFLYGCKIWILTETLIEKIDIYAGTCYRIMLGIKQTKACTNLMAKFHSSRRSASGNLSSHVTVSACRQTKPQTDFSFMNKGSSHLFDQELQGRHIPIKLRCTFYNLVKKLSKQER